VATTDRREREKTEFRKIVLDAARRIVLEGGFDALTMRKIADAIEYAPGTIYLYFQSRDAIAFELCWEGFEALLAAVAPAGAIADPQERLLDLGVRYVRFGIENPQTYRLIFMGDPKYATSLFEDRGKEEGSPGMQALALLVGAFAELRAQGRLAIDAEPYALAEMLWSAVHGIVALHLACGQFPETPPERLRELLTQTLLHGLFAAP